MGLGTLNQVNINLPYCYGVVAWAMREQHCWIDNVVRPCSTISFSNDEATRLFMVVGNRGILYLIEQASYLGLFVWSYLGKARYFCNVFDARTLLPCSHFWFYKFTSENVRRIFNYTSKDQVLFFPSRWPNYGRFCLSGELLIRIHYVLAKSKMAGDLIFFCMHISSPLWPHFRVKILLNFLHDNEVIRANLYAYKRILNRRPLTSKVYMSLVSLQKTPFMEKTIYPIF